jgi:hypothetical protein
MPSQLHEALLLLFRNRPTLAPELMRDALHFELPAFTEARIGSADLTEVKPAEYHADLVVLLLDGVPVYGIVVEVQLSRKPRKKFAWPVYASSLRARLELPVSVLVVAPDEAVARWAAQPIDLGGGNVFRPLVLGRSAVPQIVDQAQARADPELAVLSAMAHGHDDDPSKAAQIAFAAQLASLGLDDERGRMYVDLILSSLSDAARRELITMDPAKYEYQSDFAKRYIGLGRAEGRAALLQRQLTQRFGPLPEQAIERLAAATIDELDAIGERLLNAPSLDEALGPK